MWCPVSAVQQRISYMCCCSAASGFLIRYDPMDCNGGQYSHIVTISEVCPSSPYVSDAIISSSDALFSSILLIGLSNKSVASEDRNTGLQLQHQSLSLQGWFSFKVGWFRSAICILISPPYRSFYPQKIFQNF